MSRHSARLGALAGTGLALFYIAVVAGSSGSWSHLTDQVRQDWYYLAPIVSGFGIQVALISELRHRQRLQRPVAAAGSAGVGASTAGMVACCAHHLADLAPVLGATGAAAFLTDFRVPFMVVGIGVTGLGIAAAAHGLGHTPLDHPSHDQEEAGRCLVA